MSENTAEGRSGPTKAGGADPDPSNGGLLSIVGIGPGSPDHLTAAAKETIASADAVYAAPLYQTFLRADGVLPPDGSEGSGPTVIDSKRGRQAELARESFERVRSGQDVVHVSGGDPNVYGKPDLLLSLAEQEAREPVDIEVVPGVTAALAGAARLGAPLSNDFATVSLSESWRDWSEIETKLRGAARAGFVLALYNGWRDLDRAVAVLREIRNDAVPVAILEDVARGKAGRHPGGETVTLSTLGSVLEDWTGDPTPGTLAIVGTQRTRTVRNGDEQFLVTPRGEYDPEEI